MLAHKPRREKKHRLQLNLLSVGTDWPNSKVKDPSPMFYPLGNPRVCEYKTTTFRQLSSKFEMVIKVETRLPP